MALHSETHEPMMVYKRFRYNVKLKKLFGGKDEEKIAYNCHRVNYAVLMHDGDDFVRE